MGPSWEILGSRSFLDSTNEQVGEGHIFKALNSFVMITEVV